MGAYPLPANIELDQTNTPALGSSKLSSQSAAPIPVSSSSSSSNSSSSSITTTAPPTSSFSVPFRNVSGGAPSVSFENVTSNGPRWTTVMQQHPEESTDYDLGLNSSSWVWRDDAQSNAAHLMNMSIMSAPNSRNHSFADRNNEFESPKPPQMALPVAATMLALSNSGSINTEKNTNERIQALEEKCSSLALESSELKEQLEESIRENEITKAKLDGFMNYMRDILENMSNSRDSSFIKLNMNPSSNNNTNVENKSEVENEAKNGRGVTLTVDVEALATTVNAAISDHQEAVNTIGDDSYYGERDSSSPLLSSNQVAEVVSEALNQHLAKGSSNHSVSFVNAPEKKKSFGEFIYLYIHIQINEYS
jgi:hypothetical protein